jgi:uncharacterized small protein (DUF1192 family)
LAHQDVPAAETAAIAELDKAIAALRLEAARIAAQAQSHDGKYGGVFE